jgi:hypothetical protein
MRRAAVLLCAALLPRAARASVLASSSLETCFQGSAGGSTVSLRRVVAHMRTCICARLRGGAAWLARKKKEQCALSARPFVVP